MKSKSILMIVVAIVLAGSLSLAVQTPSATPAGGSLTADRVIDKAIEQERALQKRMTTLRPLIETYTQQMAPNAELGAVPTGDKYFLGKLDLSNGVHQKSLMQDSGGGFMGPLSQRIKQLYSVTYVPEGFAAMILLQPNFDKTTYDFSYADREFLGEVRCFTFDVQPRKKDTAGGFSGRIWIEDQDFNIVRFNGTRSRDGGKLFFHFDSWRENMGPGLWLPAYVYTEESDMAYMMGRRKLNFKGQTRLWGYNVGKATQPKELTSLVIDADNVQDKETDSDSITPLEASRAWQRQAEDNVLRRLENAGLVAPQGPVDKVLETVINNLEITNNLDLQPPVRARVLLTTPVESFTVGNTIVLSRGFVDVLPDEASLALALAHELGHIALGHTIDTRYAFNDRTLFKDEEAFMQLSMQRTPAEESAADKKGIEYLKNSPYKDKLSSAALFLSALQQRAPELPGLLRPHLGNQVTNNGKVERMAGLIPQAPKLEMQRTDQIAALPLGGRIKVDLWNDHIDLIKSKNIPVQFAREKMPFEVTPVFIYLTRQKPQTTAQSR